MNKGIFVTGTGTDVGKTYVTALLLKKLREHTDAVYYKAALSGAEESDGRLIAGDAQYVCHTAGIAGDPNDYVSFIYRNAVSPHLAARLEGNPCEPDKVKLHFETLCEKHNFVVAEGSGGIICPIRFDERKIMLTDIIKLLELDIVIVTDTMLGSINSAVLTYEYARSQGIKVRGFLLNRYDASNVMHTDNKHMIEHLTGADILGYVMQNGSELISLMDINKSLLNGTVG